jgi:SpoVK/Ycf46/Vps4 family AAA+-type ATPase
VGQSEANLKRALRALDGLGGEAPIVCVLDEIDTIAREGLDGGTSSGMYAELLTWLQESVAQVVVVATLNRLDKLDAALESRFQARFFYDLPTRAEREAVAGIHYRRLGCQNIGEAASATAGVTDGYSSREIAEHVCPSVARRSGRNPTASVINEVTTGYTPASKTQETQLNQMRAAAGSLRRANDPVEVDTTPRARRVAKV